MEPLNTNISYDKIENINKNITYNEMDNTVKMYRGVIENNDSPKKDGRVQVRIFGIHDGDKNNVKTEHLPWAEVMYSLSFGYNSGIGFNSIPNKGTWVFIILDHNNPNKPIVLGSISGKSIKSADKSKGFNDPDGIFPLNGDLPENSTCQGPNRLNEEDQNRLQRVENLDKTIHKVINDNLDEVTKTDSTSGADVSMNEPHSLNDESKYPNVSVLETKSGHIIEVDDTPNNERIRIYHKSGTYKEYIPDGSISEKTKKNIDKIVEGYVHEHIKKEVKKYIESNLDEIIEGYVKRYINKTLDEHIAGKVTLTHDDDVVWNIGKNLTINVNKDITITSGGKETVTNGGDYKHVAPNIYLN